MYRFSIRIHDLLQLQFLYPDIPKNTAFGQYYNPLQGEITL